MAKPCKYGHTGGRYASGTCIECSRARYLADPVKNMLKAAERRSQERGTEYKLQRSDIEMPTHCKYLGFELSLEGPTSHNSPSLDRINPKKGYTPDNVQVISHQANTMKSNATEEELVLFAKAVLKHHE